MAIFDFVKVKELTLTPTIDTAAYGSGDQIGTLMTFRDAVFNGSGAAFLVGWEIFDAAQQDAALYLWLYDRSVTLAADNAAFALADADAVHVIDRLATGTYVAVGSTSGFYRTWLTTPIPLVPFSHNSIFASLQSNASTPDYVAATDLTVKLMIAQYGAGI